MSEQLVMDDDLHPISQTTSNNTPPLMAVPPGGDSLVAALKHHFGFDDFQVGQRAVIEDVLAGLPTVAVMPTGAGKSLCYQLPALLLDGVTVVVSPLISLMKDQVDSLQARGVQADFINSTQSTEEQMAALHRVASGITKLVYVAPERFRHGAFLRALSVAKVALMAIDEAHCISRWGHDFRPDYMRLGQALRKIKPQRVLACTATATEEVRQDITRTLGFEEPSIHVHGFLRSNLYLEARLCSGDNEKLERIVEFVTDGPGREGAVIVYCSTRKKVEKFAVGLWKSFKGRQRVVQYHGGMDDNARAMAQEEFMSGQARIAVATNAFGMGVDRSDVRAVVHADLPRTVEGYYQEVGRAGRDRQPSHCLLLFNPNDTRVHEFLIDQSNPGPGAIAQVWRLVRNVAVDRPVPLDTLERLVPDQIKSSLDASLRFLSRVDVVGRDPDNNVWASADAPADVSLLGLNLDDMAAHRDAEMEKLNRMKAWVTSAPCRHRYILDYFGEAYSGECPGCDRCHPDRSSRPAPLNDGPPSEAEVLIIRKGLAGVARAEGRFGMKKVAGMLAGSRAKGVANTRLSGLSTFGILKALGGAGCGELLRILIEQGVCELDGGQYPLIQINAEGWAVMQGHTPPGFRLPPHLVPGTPIPIKVRPRKSSSSAPAGVMSTVSPSGNDTTIELDEQAPEFDDGRLDLLRAFRKEEAANADAPPYTIFSNKTMMQIAARSPLDEASFLAVPGLGPTRWERYGERLIKVVEQWA
ncbi:MAG: RecQ family ATP-dependent DNA helicase [Bradymonadia bacterium]